MTDNDIKKALECCLSKNYEDCKVCPTKDLSTDYLECRNKLRENALDYINRLEAENETLRTCVENNFVIRKDGKSPLSLLKIKAYKELLNCLESRLVSKTKMTAFGYEIAIIEIKNLLKEMVGEDNSSLNNKN